MRRRDFLRIASAAPLGSALSSTAAGSAATVLYDDHAVVLNKLLSDATVRQGELWVAKSDLQRINGFELKPQGACRQDVCIPIPKEMIRGSFFNLTAFARKLGQSVVADAASKVWSFGEIPVLRGSFLTSRMAPDFAVPDRKGRIVHLSDFRGKKVLVVTWASW